jgi:hypothetical protein
MMAVGGSSPSWRSIPRDGLLANLTALIDDTAASRPWPDPDNG